MHIKHAFEYVMGPSTGPTEKMFKKLRDNWGDVKDKIDYEDLSCFDWNQLSKTVVEQEAKVTLEIIS